MTIVNIIELKAKISEIKNTIEEILEKINQIKGNKDGIFSKTQSVNKLMRLLHNENTIFNDFLGKCVVFNREDNSLKNPSFLSIDDFFILLLKSNLKVFEEFEKFLGNNQN